LAGIVRSEVWSGAVRYVFPGVVQTGLEFVAAALHLAFDAGCRGDALTVFAGIAARIVAIGGLYPNAILTGLNFAATALRLAVGTTRAALALD
jgi:hypothetical protein